MQKLVEIANETGGGCIEFLIQAGNKDAFAFYDHTIKSNIISDKLHYMRLDLHG
ncbi:hypothetical protein [Legionella septentrionalis]|uniref:hypothetical protein n=1 Tax=Legionella septentrionalis TaxID=2498109 RepID=UPI0013152212|nr:hypothetical protein [Legionella septentrionalis]